MGSGSWHPAGMACAGTRAGPGQSEMPAGRPDPRRAAGASIGSAADCCGASRRARAIWHGQCARPGGAVHTHLGGAPGHREQQVQRHLQLLCTVDVPIARGIAHDQLRAARGQLHAAASCIHQLQEWSTLCTHEPHQPCTAGQAAAAAADGSSEYSPGRRACARKDLPLKGPSLSALVQAS